MHCKCCLVPRRLSMKICARRKVGRRKRARSRFSFLLPMVPCATSLVTRVSHAFRPSLCAKTKRLKTTVSTCRERLKHSWRWVVFTADWVAGCLTSFLTSWVLIGCLTDWLTDLPVDLKTDELIDWLTDWPINCLGVTVEQTDCSTASDWRTDGPIAY